MTRFRQGHGAKVRQVSAGYGRMMEPGSGRATVTLTSALCPRNQAFGLAWFRSNQASETLRTSASNWASDPVTSPAGPGAAGASLGAELAHRPGMKVLFMSGYTDHAVLSQGVFESGAAFLQKPFSPTTLAKGLREMLDHA
jgi:hypothetical protein